MSPMDAERPANMRLFTALQTRGEIMIRRCAQYVTKNGRRVPCDRPCWGHFTVLGMEGATYISLRPHRRTVIDAMHEDMARAMI